MRPLLSISPSVFTPAYLGPRSLNIIAEQATVTRHRPTLRPLLHSRRSTVYIVVSRTLARYALPSMRFKCTLETLRNCTESSPHLFFSFFPLSLYLASFARDDAFSSFDRAPHSTQPLPLSPPAHARLNVSVQHRVNGKIRKPGRISDAYLLPHFTSRPRKQLSS